MADPDGVARAAGKGTGFVYIEFAESGRRKIESGGTDDLEGVPEEVSRFDCVLLLLPVAGMLDKFSIAGACLKRFIHESYSFGIVNVVQGKVWRPCFLPEIPGVKGRLSSGNLHAETA